MSKKVMGDFGFNMSTNQLNGTMGNDIVDFFNKVTTKVITPSSPAVTSSTPTPTSPNANEKIMTYLKYGAIALSVGAIAYFAMKKMKKK